MFCAPYLLDIWAMKNRRDALRKMESTRPIEIEISQLEEDIEELKECSNQYDGFKDSVDAGTFIFSMISILLVNYWLSPIGKITTVLVIIIVCLLLNFLLKTRIIELCFPLRRSVTQSSNQQNMKTGSVVVPSVENKPKYA